MRPNPGAEMVLKLLGLVKLISGSTQLYQYSNGFVVAWATTAYYFLIDLMPVIPLVIVNILQMSQTLHFLPLALLAFQSGIYSLAFDKQFIVGDALTSWWHCSGLVLAQLA